MTMMKWMKYRIFARLQTKFVYNWNISPCKTDRLLLDNVTKNNRRGAKKCCNATRRAAKKKREANTGFYTNESNKCAKLCCFYQKCLCSRTRAFVRAFVHSLTGIFSRREYLRLILVGRTRNLEYIPPVDQKLRISQILKHYIIDVVVINELQNRSLLFRCPRRKTLQELSLASHRLPPPQLFVLLLITVAKREHFRRAKTARTDFLDTSNRLVQIFCPSLIVVCGGHPIRASGIAPI